jgi:hypothetical protein
VKHSYAKGSVALLIEPATPAAIVAGLETTADEPIFMGHADRRDHTAVAGKWIDGWKNLTS